MKSLLSLILILLFSTGLAFAQAINSEFIPSQSASHLKEGDLFEATLRFWPIENADFSQFKKMEKSTLFNALYLAQITGLGVSANNADVVELKGIFVVKSAKLDPLYVFKYNNNPIEMRSGDIKVSSLNDASQDFYILDQSLDASYLWKILSGIGLVLLLIAFFQRKKLYELVMRFRLDEKKKAKKRYDNLFRSASKREDFELLYQEKNLWLNLLENKAPAHVEFLKVLNTYQYKKEWNNEELSEVRSSFDVIRRSFEK